MKKAVLVLVFIISVSWQEPKQNTEQIFHYGFTMQETNTILSALSKLPYEQSAALISKIQDTAFKQLPKK